MICEKRSTNDAKFAEECRKALEKSWGTQIPKPKSIGKKPTFEKSCKRLKKMQKEKLWEALKRSQKTNEPLEEKGKAKTKNQQQKRLSSQEFLKKYDTMWREGPKTEYQNPDSWRKNGDII